VAFYLAFAEFIALVDRNSLSSSVQMNSRGIAVTILSLISVTQNGTTGGWVPDTAAGLPAVSN